MSDTELLIEEIKTLPKDHINEVRSFVEYIKYKEQRRQEDWECPLDHTPNAETIAALEEGNAMLGGELPARWHDSLEDLLKDLRS